MKDISDLITETNSYMKNNSLASLNAVLLKEIGIYCTSMLRVSKLVFLILLLKTFTTFYYF